MNVLFVVRTTGHMRYHRSIVEALIHRNHAVTLLFDPRFSSEESIAKAQVTCRTIGCAIAPAIVPRTFGYWVLLHTRDLLSYRRYLVNADIAHLEPFRKDWKVHLPLLARIFLKMPGGAQLLMFEWFANMLIKIEELISPNVDIQQDIIQRIPDVLIASPVNMRESSAELEYLKAAHVLGIKTVIQVLSWDNLTVRGLFHIVPDRLLCWNNVQADEACRHQGMSPARIKIVGAPAFDSWFSQKRSPAPREEFCRRWGLREEHLIVTYLGSARNIAQDETAVIRALRLACDVSNDERIRKIQIVLRVHPGNYKAYVDFSVPGVMEVPPRGSLPDTDDALQLFHDTLAHSIAVIQVNTSGAIDAIIDGTPCISLLYPEFAKQQVDTIHFKQLMKSGATDLPKTPEECVACITRLLDGEDARADARKRFISSFIRPRGIERAAGEFAADEVEALARGVASGGTKKVLFALRSWANISNFSSIISAVVERGYETHLLFDKHFSSADSRCALDELTERHPAILWGFLERRRLFRPIVLAVREIRTYRNYLVTEGQSDYYRRRWRRYLPLVFRIAVRLPGSDAFLKSEMVGRWFGWFENTLTPARRILAHLEDIRPDVVVASPATMRFSPITGYIKAARALSIPTALPIYSWDNLTTKGLIHEHPDRVLVWNAVQLREVVRIHGIAERAVRIVGACVFDKWFTPIRTTSRDVFCRMWNIDPTRPFILYVGSSRNIATNEIWLIKKLRKAFDAGVLGTLQILARPHPANVRPYRALNTAFARVMALDRGAPVSAKSAQTLHDALAHAVLVVGINTSAMLDAICLNRPVISVLAPMYQETQEEASHFKALRESGAIEVVSDASSCAARVEAIVAGEDVTAGARKLFVSTFLRPRGIERAAGEFAADEIEEMLKSSVLAHTAPF